jgi:glycosyltransferase involved in cell wall biosynthesis
MALYTAGGLLDDFAPVIIAPSGPALDEARSSGYETIRFQNSWEFSRVLRPRLAANKRLAFFATGVMHSAVCLAWNKLYRRRIAHLHLVHGGSSEALSYGQKRRLNGQPVEFVAVSSYVRERLIANGVQGRQIQVIENFQPDALAGTYPRRAAFDGSPVRRLIVISRLDPEKRVDLFLEALETDPEPGRFEVRIFGTGWDGEHLKQRAAKSKLNIIFEGFRSDVRETLAESDLLVHLCPMEPFGLAIIEAMAAGVPVLVPDAGGAGSLVREGVSGFRFLADDARHLMETINRIVSMSPALLNAVVSEAAGLLGTRFSQVERIEDYRRLLIARLT